MVVRARALMCHELRYRLRQLIICTFSICGQSCVPCETAVCSLLSVKSSVKSHRLLSRDLFALFSFDTAVSFSFSGHFCATSSKR